MPARIGVETIPLHQSPYFVSPKYQDKRPAPPFEKVTFLKSASSAGSKIENYFLSPKVFGSGNSIGLNF
jgi:hypothetical protein